MTEERLRAALPEGVPVQAADLGPLGGIVVLTCRTRLEAYRAFLRFDAEPLAIVRKGNVSVIKPALSITPHDDRHHITEALHPVFWWHRHDGARLLVWWTVVQLRENEGSRTLVRFEAHIANDPAWLAEKQIMGGPRGDTVLSYVWKPRDYPTGEVIALPGLARDKPGSRSVWFPLDRPVREALGLGAGDGMD